MDHKERFWHWFLLFLQSFHREDGCRSGSYLKFMEKMDYHLDAYCGGLCYLYETDTVANSFCRFTVYGCGDRSKLVHVQKLIRHAPRIDGLRYFSSFPATIDLDDFYCGTDAPFVYNDIAIKASELKFEPVGLDPETDKLFVVFYVLNLPEGFDDELYRTRIQTVVLHALGEYDFYECVSDFDLARYEADFKGLLDLIDLPLFFRTLKEDL